ncbi:MAG: mechanosensitive ion channel family protein [Cytophagia bacterium]|nr:mechanosensitive ion channel family protein [Cytophagia bacterium]
MNKPKVNRPLDQTKKEKRRVIYFFLKLILLVAGLVLRYMYPDKFEDLRAQGNIVPALLYYLIGILIVSSVRISMVYLYLKRTQRESDFKDNYILGINRIASILSVFVLFLSVLYYFQIDTQQFLTSISIVAAAIAIVFREYIVNSINGFIWMFSNQFSLKDYIKVGEYEGRIMDINLLNVVLLNDEDEIVYVPNTLMAASMVVNSSKKDFKKLSFDFELVPETLGDIDHFEDYLVESLKSQFKDINLENFSLKVDMIKKDAVALKLRITVDRKQKNLERPVRRFINKSILSYSNEIKGKKED